MFRLVVLVVLTILAIGVAELLRRRRPEPPTAPSYRAPAQIDRADFNGAESERLVAVFTSATCDSCAVAWDLVQGVSSPTTAVQRIEIQDDPSLHQRYKIDGVPTVLIADADGVVLKSFFGPPTADALDDALR